MQKRSHGTTVLEGASNGSNFQFLPEHHGVLEQDSLDGSDSHQESIVCKTEPYGNHSMSRYNRHNAPGRPEGRPLPVEAS